MLGKTIIACVVYNLVFFLVDIIYYPKFYFMIPDKRPVLSQVSCPN